ncbi:MAG: antitoxin VapB family protein [Candidatus Lokiarchaeota archaeon]|nr:antitoxin VapB family protein [Candidatus Harpocratesius repetitus]
MASKSISITEDVYLLLKKFQLKGESFSQTILRLINRQENILKLAGAWSKIPNNEEAVDFVEKVVEKLRNQPNNPIKMV